MTDYLRFGNVRFKTPLLKLPDQEALVESQKRVQDYQIKCLIYSHFIQTRRCRFDKSCLKSVNRCSHIETMVGPNMLNQLLTLESLEIVNGCFSSKLARMAVSRKLYPLNMLSNTLNNPNWFKGRLYRFLGVDGRLEGIFGKIRTILQSVDLSPRGGRCFLRRIYHR